MITRQGLDPEFHQRSGGDIPISTSVAASDEIPRRTPASSVHIDGRISCLWKLIKALCSVRGSQDALLPEFNVFTAILVSD